MNKVTFRVDNLEISPEIQPALARAHLMDVKKILILSPNEIERQTGLSSNLVAHLKSSVTQKFLPHKLCTGYELFKKSASEFLHTWKLPTSCPAIDNILRGGILPGILTEVSGESASGKTQFCLQLCISAQINKHKTGGAAYICTEDVFPSKRLQQLIHFHSRKLPQTKFGDGIFIEHIADFEMLDFCVTKKLPTLLNRGVVDIVIIDSVAALFRCHYDVTQTVGRAKHLITFAASLQKLALQYNIPIVCVNQVTSNVNGSSSNENNLIPSLGLTWSNQVSCRIMLSRPSSLSLDMVNHKESHRKTQLTEPSYRKLSLVFAPHLAPVELSVFIDNSGMHGI